jgi:hypothetical protein
MNRTISPLSLLIIALLCLAAGPAVAQQKKPNIILIMGDDIGWSNIGVYSQGHHGG